MALDYSRPNYSVPEGDENKWTLVTPTMAERWLNKNKNNRTMKPGVAERYTEDMRNGTWTLCAAPIQFYEGDLGLADGQHRLWAVIESAAAQWFIVVNGIPREAAMNIDRGATRNLSDNVQIATGETLSTTKAATALVVHRGTRQTRINHTDAQKLEIYQLHREAVDFSSNKGPWGKGLRNAITLGVMARAWYHEQDKERLATWGRVVSSGMGDGPPDSAAIALRNHLLMKTHNLSDNTSWLELWKKAQHSIKLFMKRKPISILRPVEEEDYPLPADKARVKIGTAASARRKSFAKAGGDTPLEERAQR